MDPADTLTGALAGAPVDGHAVAHGAATSATAAAPAATLQQDAATVAAPQVLPVAAASVPLPPVTMAGAGASSSLPFGGPTAAAAAAARRPPTAAAQGDGGASCTAGGSPYADSSGTVGPFYTTCTPGSTTPPLPLCPGGGGPYVISPYVPYGYSWGAPMGTPVGFYMQHPAAIAVPPSVQPYSDGVGAPCIKQQQRGGDEARSLAAAAASAAAAAAKEEKLINAVRFLSHPASKSDSLHIRNSEVLVQLYQLSQDGVASDIWGFGF